MKELGYKVGKVDGIYGKNTAAAIKAFQKNNGLTEDGYAGKDTINKMLTEDVKKANTTKTPITETNKEQENNKETLEIWWVEHIIIRPKTIEEIPTPDKRDKTKKKVYEFWGYRFFDNWRAMNLNDGNMHNTTDIIQKLQKQQKLSSKEFDEKYHSTIQKRFFSK